MEGLQKLLTRKEAANYFSLKEQTLAVWASTGRYELPFIKVGGRAMYSEEDLNNFLNARRRTSTN